MSLIDRVRPGPKPPQAPAVERQVQAAREAFTAIEQQHGELALAAVLGEEGATASLEKWDRELAAARQQVERLQAAHRTAVDRDAAALEAQREALRKTQRLAQRKHLETRDRAAQSFSAAVADAVRAYQTMIREGRAAIAATPVQSTFPNDSLCVPGALEIAVRLELYRLSGIVQNANVETPQPDHQMRFPASAAPTEFIDRPTEIEPILNVLKADTVAVLQACGEKAD